jgi:hypothetical protein
MERESRCLCDGSCGNIATPLLSPDAGVGGYDNPASSKKNGLNSNEGSVFEEKENSADEAKPEVKS